MKESYKGEWARKSDNLLQTLIQLAHSPGDPHIATKSGDAEDVNIRNTGSHAEIYLAGDHLMLNAEWDEYGPWLNVMFSATNKISGKTEIRSVFWASNPKDIGDGETQMPWDQLHIAVELVRDWLVAHRADIQYPYTLRHAADLEKWRG